MKKVKVPQFGREEMIDGIRTVTMESKEVVIIELAEKVNEIIDYLETHTSKEEIKSWAYTFLGDTANIRCDENIKTVMVFRGGESWEFTIPTPNEHSEPNAN